MAKQQIVITLEEDGQYGNVSVTGPLENKMLCYGLLEVARDIVAAHGVSQQRITLPEHEILRSARAHQFGPK